MIKRIVALAVMVCLSVVSGVVPAEAQSFFDPPGQGTPSPVEYGWRGLFIGALTGLSAGYIRYADSDDTDAMLLSVAYGSLGGAVGGIIAGLSDGSTGEKGMGDLILRDMALGGGFGAAVGTIYGGITALVDDDWQRLGTGAAWGYLGGIVLGAGIALYTGPSVLEEEDPGEAPAEDDDFTPSVMFLEDSQSNIVTAFGVTYGF